MKENKVANNSIKVKHLVHELLKIDPAALASVGASVGASGDLVEAGLHEFMWRLLEGSLGPLCAPDDWQLRLRSDAAARALGYHDARICTLTIVR